MLPGCDPMTISAFGSGSSTNELRWKEAPAPSRRRARVVLTPLEGGRTRVDHWERFSGVLLPIARSLVYDDTVAAFQMLNDALSTRAAE
jgi:hypothetical protein